MMKLGHSMSLQNSTQLATLVRNSVQDNKLVFALSILSAIFIPGGFVAVRAVFNLLRMTS